MRHHRLAALVVAGVLSLFAALLITADGPWTGPKLFGITPEHGVHAGDLMIGAAWLVGVMAAVLGGRR